MKKITGLELAVIIILLCAIFIFLIPIVKGDFEKKKEAQISANAAIFTSKALSYFNTDKTLKASYVANKTLEELNSISKNPYNRKQKAYVFEKGQKGAILVEFDDNIQTITVTGFNKSLQIVVRTVIKPPSFVTYEKNKEQN